METLAGTTTLAVSVCPRCGTIAKSGKMSCCGRGGSWFKNCGGLAKMKLQHTWHEGIQICKSKSGPKRFAAQKLNIDQQQDTDSFQGGDMTHYKEVKTFTFTSVNTSMSESANTFVTSSTPVIITSVTAKKCVNLLQTIWSSCIVISFVI